MLCNICQKREATVHFNFISGDVLKKSDLCDECFAASKPSEAGALTAALKAGCRYCGGELFNEGGDAIAMMSGPRNTGFVCKPCEKEYFHFLRLKMPGFGSATFMKKQAAELAECDEAAIYTEAEEHMKKWVTERHSQ